MTPPVVDTGGRALRDVRISLTDHCNLRCTYCMPKDRVGLSFLPSPRFLSFEEIILDGVKNRVPIGASETCVEGSDGWGLCAHLRA
jgi:hypothetical protein